MRVVIAPDSFKGTATAAQVAAAVAAGWLQVRPDDTVEAVPMADGGEGSLEAFASAFPDAVWHPLSVTGPVGGSVEAAWLELPGSIGVVELACTSGITLLQELDAARAHTIGFGEAVRAALEAGMGQVITCIGGSASSDGGAGMLIALGAKLLDLDGEPIPLGAAGLDELASVDLTGLVPPPSGGAHVVTDVDAPLLGPTGAIQTYGPQKGVAVGDFTVYERRLARLATLLGVDPDVAGCGAAGGAGAGLVAWGAVLRPGADEVAHQLDLEERLTGADLVITGEGRFDQQSAAGKVPDHVARLAARKGIPAALVAGGITSPTPGFVLARSLVELAGGEVDAMTQTIRWLSEAGRSLAGAIVEGHASGQSV